MPFVTTIERLAYEEAVQQGLKQGLRHAIEVVLKIKFGRSALSLMPEIRAIDDSARLETILDSIETAASPEDLRRIWAG